MPLARVEAKWRIKFASHKADAKRRGIPFLFTFNEWFEVWKTSGKMHRRGHGTGRYVMARLGDRGGYEIKNVKIVLFEQNAREYRPTLDAKTRTGAAHAGKIVSAETRKKLAQKAKLRKHTLESRSKMSVSRKRNMQFVLRSQNGQFALGGMTCR